MAHYAGTYEEGYVPFSFNQPVVSDPADTASVINPIGDLDSGGALDKLRNLANENPEYMETYLQLLAERENTYDARRWYENLSDSQYQRAVADLRKAGLNPALALTALSGASSGSVSPAGTWNNSPYANKLAKENVELNKTQAGIKLAGMLTTSVLAMVAMLL